ncbi:MAG: ABC transporter permease [Chloroflexota bacterium]
MATTTIIPPVEAKTWRDTITFTRLGVFSAFFIILGVGILLGPARNIASDATTGLTLNQAGEIIIPAVPFLTLVAILYILGGIVGLLPKANQRRLKTAWLVFDAILIVPAVLVITAAGGKTNLVVLLQESLRVSTPLVLGALAGIWCERAGVVNIAIEGMMLTGACMGFVALMLLTTGDNALPTAQAQFIGVIVAALSGAVMAMLHAWLSIKYKTNQIVSGTVINILAIGLTSFIRRDVLITREATRGTLTALAIPGLSKIPVLGEVFFNGKPIFYGMFILLVVTHVVMYYTRWGLRTRAVGENPHAADTLGINVIRNRWTNVIIGGLIAGFAGAWFTLETTGAFSDNMTSGKGFIALAAMIFGNWTPIGAFAGGLLFGFSEALGQRFQFLGVPIPSQFLQMVPYIITIVVLAGVIGKASPPKADGVPFEKE